MEFDQHSSPPVLNAEPEFISSSVKSEPQDVPPHEEPFENTWQPASPSQDIKSEPAKEEIKVEESVDVAGSSFYVYLHSGAGMSEFLQEDSKYLDTSDDIAQFGSVSFKNDGSDNVKVEPECVKKSELTIEDEGPAADTERLSLEFTLTRSDLQQEYMNCDTHSYLGETYSDSSKNFNSRLLPLESPLCSSMLPTTSCSGTKISGCILESTRKTVCTNSSNLESYAICKDDSNLFDDKCDSRKKKFICSTCNKAFAYKENLKVHSKIHTGEKPYICSLCKKSFARNDDLKTHTRIHTGEKPYVCTICNKSFAQKTDLKRHTRIHTGEKPYVCTICNKSFAQKKHLTGHSRIHTGEKPYECSTCNKGFALKGNLRRHTKIHTGEKPYVCTTCNKSFTQKELLRAHSTFHTGEKPYVCSVCSKTFAFKGNLRRHSKIHSGEKPFVC